MFSKVKRHLDMSLFDFKARFVISSGTLKHVLRAFAVFLVCLCAPGHSAGAPPVILLPAGSTDEDIAVALAKENDGGEVVLAPGTYLIHKPIVLQHDHQSLRGAGTNTILRLADHANCPVIVLGAPKNAPHHGTANLHVASLFIDGNRTNQNSELWRAAGDGSILNNNGIDVYCVTNAIIEHIVCCRCRSGGLVASAGTRQLAVTDFAAFDNQYDGLACYLTEDSLFKGLYLHDNTAAGISIDLGFNHNTIQDAILTGNELGIFMRDSRSNTFQNITIGKSRNHGVFMAQATSPTKNGWRLTPGTACTGNTFSGLTITNSGGKAFLIANASCTNNHITDSRFVDNAKGGLDQSSDVKLVSVVNLVEHN
jgi:parallel beta-helix repeat protein